MPFDMGFNFRASSGYVTDPSYAVPVLGETYPHTYTNADGKSINAGWTPYDFAADRANTNDPRLAGINYGAGDTFTVDLASGSAPGAGAYTVDIAMGDANNGQSVQGYTLKDSTTTLIDGTTGGSGVTTNAGHFLDATVADVAATTTWTGTTVAKTFATTTCTLFGLSGGNAVFAHFRLTLAEVVAAINLPFASGRSIFKVTPARWG